MKETIDKKIKRDLNESNFGIFLQNIDEYSDLEKIEKFKEQYEKFQKTIKNINFKNNHKELKDIALKIFNNNIEFEICSKNTKQQLDNKLKQYFEYEILAGKLTIEKYYKVICNDFNNKNFKWKMIEGEFDFFKEMVIDFNCLLTKYEDKFLIKSRKDKVKRYLFPDGRKLYDISRQLKIQQLCKGDIECISISVFSLRQSIEVALKNALGIDYILENGQVCKKLMGNKLIKFIKANKFINIEIDIKILQEIFFWTNSYIHTGKTPYMWEIDIAHDLLKDFFYYKDKYFIGIKFIETYYLNKKKREKDLLKHLKVKNGEVFFIENKNIKLVESFGINTK